MKKEQSEYFLYKLLPQNLRIAQASNLLMTDFTVIGGPCSEQLAKRIASKIKSKFVGCELRVFQDGESKITLKDKPDGKIIVVQSIYPPVDSNLIRSLAIISEARSYSSQVYAVIPYMGYARQDRQFLPGEIITMELVAKMFKTAGTTELIVVDIHSITALQHWQIPTKNVSAVEELADYFKKLSFSNPLVVSPDKGGIERAGNFAKLLGIDFIALDKHRDRKTGNVVIKTKDLDVVQGRDIIIVDDMISTGGSIIKAAEFLKKQKSGKIYVCCTHALLIGNAEKKIMRAGVTKIISANTVPGKTSIVDISSAIVKALV